MPPRTKLNQREKDFFEDVERHYCFKKGWSPSIAPQVVRVEAALAFILEPDIIYRAMESGITPSVTAKRAHALLEVQMEERPSLKSALLRLCPPPVFKENKDRNKEKPVRRPAKENPYLRKTRQPTKGSRWLYSDWMKEYEEDHQEAERASQVWEEEMEENWRDTQHSQGYWDRMADIAAQGGLRHSPLPPRNSRFAQPRRPAPRQKSKVELAEEALSLGSQITKALRKKR